MKKGPSFVIPRLVICAVALFLFGSVTSCGPAIHPRLSGAEPEFIGSATIDEAGAISLDLVSYDHGSIAHGFMVYHPGDPNYENVRQHIGPIRPGETVSVRPWPDPPRRRN
jgi:hypothetical protein